MEPFGTIGAACAGGGTGAQNGSPGWGISRCMTVQPWSTSSRAASPMPFKWIFMCLAIPLTCLLLPSRRRPSHHSLNRLKVLTDVLQHLIGRGNDLGIHLI